MIVGLTGGIGSGKSTIARMFELLGCLIFESDRVAKEVYFDAEVRPKVISLLGPDAYLSDTSLNKAYVSSKIFSDKTSLECLNAIIHPVVIRRSKEFARNNPGKIILKETALLFEAHMEKDVDKSVVVVADDETRIQRVMQRDGLTREEVLRKIKSQLPQEEKIKRSDFVIYNDETELVIPQVLKIFDTLVKKTMLRKDLLQRQFEEFGKMLAQLLSHKKDKSWEEFEKLAEEASLKFTAMELSDLENLSDADFKVRCIDTRTLNYDQKKIIASLLFEKMRMYEEMQVENKYLPLRTKCSMLYKHLADELMQNEYDLEVHYRLKLLASS